MTKKTKINQSDLKIYPSERLRQTDDGGGMPTGKPLTGALNELFNPISSIARVNGGFYAVLEYMGVQRADAEPLIGAFCAITRPPSDPTVSYLLFKANRFGESRAEILKRIEAYNTKTIESRMTLLSTQAKNSKVVQAYQTVGEPLPNVGDRYCLDQNTRGYVFKEQFIQVAKVTAEDREFVSPQGKKFKKTVIKLEITTKLEADFVGVEYPKEGHASPPCKIRETGVADAAQYYGVKPLAANINKNVMQIKVASLMEKIAPVNQISTPLVDLTAAGQRQTLFDGSRTGDDGVVSLRVNKNHSPNKISQLHFGNAITPDSVLIQTNRGNITDKGGTLYLNQNQNQGQLPVGSVDYAHGTALINEPTFSAWIEWLKFRPAMAALKVADTQKIDISINNRSDSHTFSIVPPPAVFACRIRPPAGRLPLTLHRNRGGVPASALPLPLMCWHDTAPTFVPNLRSYLVHHIITATLGGLNIDPIKFDIKTDMDSYCWSGNIEISHVDYQRIKAKLDVERGNEPLILVNVNGNAFGFIAENVSRKRQFGASVYQLSGRSSTARLGQDYAQAQGVNGTGGTIEQDLYASQIMRMQLNDLPFSIDEFHVDDWLIPSGTLNVSNQTPISIISQLATACGGKVISHVSEPKLSIIKRWRVPAWEMATAKPSLVVPMNVVQSISDEKRTNPRHNTVTLIGRQQAFEIYRQGQGRNLIAPVAN